VENGDIFATFLSSINRVEVDKHALTLILQNAFYKEWVMEENNKRSIINIIKFYTEAPAGIELKTRNADKEAGKPDIKNKLQKRYKDLVE